MFVRLRPPFVFRPVWHNGAPALEILFVRPGCGQEHHGFLSLDAARFVQEGLGEALAAARALTPPPAGAPIVDEAEGLPDRKTQASGDTDVSESSVLADTEEPTT